MNDNVTLAEIALFLNSPEINRAVRAALGVAMLEDGLPLPVDDDVFAELAYDMAALVS